MGAYLVASRGGIRHAYLLGLMVTVTHMIVVFLLALVALRYAAGQANPTATFWLEIVSAALVLAVGVWMMLTTFGLLRRRRNENHGHAHEHSAHVHPGEHPHDHGHVHPHAHSHPHPHEHGHEHDDRGHHGHTHEIKLPEGKDPLGFWALTAVGASGGLVPCPAAITALLAAVNLGRTKEGIAVVGAMSLGIAATLITIGILFVQAGRVALKFSAVQGLMSYAPRISAIVITLLGLGLLGRAFVGHGH